MTQRITDANLQAVCKTINRITNSPAEPWIDGKAQIGNYHLSHCNGGVCLHRMHNEHGGVTTPIVEFHTTKRDLFDRMHAWIRGFEFGCRFTKESHELIEA